MSPTFLIVVALISGVIVLFGLQQLWERSRPTQNPQTKPDDPLDRTDLNNRLLAKHTQLRQLEDALQNRDHVRVADLMTAQVSGVPEDEPLDRVRKLMSAHRTRHLLVQNKHGVLTGIISDRDLARRQRGKARDIMTREPTTISPQSPISDALRLVLSKRVSCLPVIDGVELCGVITSTDLLLILECLLEDYEDRAHHGQSSAAICQAQPQPQAPAPIA